MRTDLPAYDLRTPGTLHESLDLLAKFPGQWRPLAGGTDVMVLLEAGKLTHTRWLNIWSLAELKGIDITADSITLGALTTFGQIRANPILTQEFPLLVQGAKETGAIAIQNRGTLGGNIMNASPAADSPPALLVYEAQVQLTSLNGSRWVPYLDFHTGYKTTLLKPDELLTHIRLRRPTLDPTLTWSTLYRKVGTRNAQAISKVCLVAAAGVKERQLKSIRIAFGAVAATPVRATRTEHFLLSAQSTVPFTPAVLDQALTVLAQEITPIDDIRSIAQYRKAVALNLLRDFLSHVELD